MRPGYKRTEVGIIPEEWEVAPVATLLGAPIQNGVFNDPSRKGWGCKLINVIDLYGRFPLETGGLERFAADKDELSRFAVGNGDVFFTRSSLTADGIAMCNVYDGAGEGPIVFDCHIIRVRPDTAKVEPLFLARSSGSSAARRYLVMNAKTTTMTTIDQSVIARLPVALPPLAEQRSITGALSDIDALLAGLDRLIAKKCDLKQAAMQQLLTGQTRLPGFHGEWEDVTLFQLAEGRKELFDDGDWIESEHITNYGIRLIQTGNIGVGRFVEKDDRKFIYEDSFTSLRCKPLKIGDLLICRLADPAGRACVLPDIGDARVVTSVDVTIFRPSVGKVDRVFLANVFSTPEWFRAVSDRSGGTTHKRISRGALGRISLQIPPIPEQTAIATVLSDMDAELTALEARRDKTRALKQAMMQELLTGRTRLV